jgi:predicted  nucleic acid-binding Zn-ribbon protein
MLIKIFSDEPEFQERINLLRLKYRTGANSKAAKAALNEFYELEIECEILRGQNESMSDEIERLRELLSHVSKQKYHKRYHKRPKTPQ